MIVSLFWVEGESESTEAFEILKAKLPEKDFSEMYVTNCTESMIKHHLPKVPAVKMGGVPYYGLSAIKSLAENYESEKLRLQNLLGDDMD